MRRCPDPWLPTTSSDHRAAAGVDDDDGVLSASGDRGVGDPHLVGEVVDARVTLVEFAACVDVSDVVPVLVDGTFRRW